MPPILSCPCENSRGLGIIDAVLWMRPVEQRRKRPRRIPLDDLTKVYINSSTPNARRERACLQPTGGGC